MAEDNVKLTLWDRAGNCNERVVELGSNLRKQLMEMGFSPYEGKFKNLNCQGMGVCGTCKVYVREQGEDWERRSCQIQCFQDLEIRLK
ncbi:MAG: hypothetical protein ACKOA8_04640 [Deltaproteobacteria bacterium]